MKKFLLELEKEVEESCHTYIGNAQLMIAVQVIIDRTESRKCGEIARRIRSRLAKED